MSMPDKMPEVGDVFEVDGVMIECIGMDDGNPVCKMVDEEAFLNSMPTAISVAAPPITLDVEMPAALFVQAAWSAGELERWI